MVRVESKLHLKRLTRVQCVSCGAIVAPKDTNQGCVYCGGKEFIILKHEFPFDNRRVFQTDSRKVILP